MNISEMKYALGQVKKYCSRRKTCQGCEFYLQETCMFLKGHSEGITPSKWDEDYLMEKRTNSNRG